jgi:tryptophan 2,3-dioxygenase
MISSNVHYGDYLQLPVLLDLQHPESAKIQEDAHDEMLFIITHQTYELWFKQLLFEVNSVCDIMEKPSINDNSPQLQTVVHRLQRVVTILKLLVQQIDVMETMTAMDFLDFRDRLRPASGFQSFQFKILEGKLGLPFSNRHGQQYYLSQLRQEELELVKKAEEAPTLLQLVNKWLERMPLFDEKEKWTTLHEAKGNFTHPFWNLYADVYSKSLQPGEQQNSKVFEDIFLKNENKRNLTAEASRAALFIMLYRGYPLLHLPFQLLQVLLEIDEQLGTWRYRHLNMVQRIIGSRVGTGGSTGKEYLAGAVSKHYIFSEIAQLTGFLIERRKLPELPEAIKRKIGFIQD